VVEERGIVAGGQLVGEPTDTAGRVGAKPRGLVERPPGVEQVEAVAPAVEVGVGGVAIPAPPAAQPRPGIFVLRAEDAVQHGQQ
jgi:hypothetical protein